MKRPLPSLVIANNELLRKEAKARRIGGTLEVTNRIHGAAWQSYVSFWSQARERNGWAVTNTAAK